ncbi:hypothetical protein MES5069_350020 [Mesorhizobium escarrei]|uniref:Uncharacterized protein n=1 Tax=Mesorhizobium escarrei TaxID=666018 RepID=A0ABM9E0Y0_9HYPH|nr:hypothetical protein MES5069_350020 [Mesorhizobium escarrei]
MLFWVCVDDKPIALPTQIDVYPGNSQPMEAKLRYQANTPSWTSSRPT